MLRKSRYQKLHLDPSGWPEREGMAGDYYCPELRETYALVLEGNSLVARSLLNPDVTLARYDENSFLGDAWWFTNLLLTRDGNGKITGFRLDADGGRVRRLRFTRDRPTDTQADGRPVAH